MLIAEESQIQGQNFGNGVTSNSFMPFVAANISVINDEVKQKQLLLEDEEEDFLDESKLFKINILPRFGSRKYSLFNIL